jgi:hypothetical protein
MEKKENQQNDIVIRSADFYFSRLLVLLLNAPNSNKRILKYVKILQVLAQNDELS